MIVSSTDQRVRRERSRRRDPEFDDLPDLVNTETGSVVDDSESDDVSGYYSDGGFIVYDNLSSSDCSYTINICFTKFVLGR